MSECAPPEPSELARSVAWRSSSPSLGSALADVAHVVMREHDRTCVWYGDPQLCQDIYSRWGGQHTHPLNTIATVVSALARSKMWRRDGYISHLGRRYPVYTPNAASDLSPANGERPNHAKHGKAGD